MTRQPASSTHVGSARCSATEILAQENDRARHDIAGRHLAVELKDILPAQRAISREFEVSKLIETLLTIAIDLLNAQRGLLFLVRGRGLEVGAEAMTGDGSVRVAFPTASVASPGFPQTVLRYMVRMEKSIALDDALADNQFSGDDYLIREHPRSLLCLPLEAQRNLTGALYLENALAPRAFAPERLAALDLLASQAAVSLRAAALGFDRAHEMKERMKAEAELKRFRRVYENPGSRRPQVSAQRPAAPAGEARKRVCKAFHSNAGQRTNPITQTKGWRESMSTPTALRRVWRYKITISGCL